MKVIDIIRACANFDGKTKVTVSISTRNGIIYPQFEVEALPYEVLKSEVLCFTFLNEEEKRIFHGSEVLFTVIKKEN